MKKAINIFVTICIIVVLKGCICVPLWLCVSPFVTAYQWGGISKLRYALPFCVKSAWHTLKTDWEDCVDAIIYDLKK